MDADLRPELIERGRRGVFGAPLELHAEIDSTNRRALEWARQGAPEGALVIAEHQTAGRGRWGRSWSSRSGRGLLFSVVLRRGVGGSGLLTTALGVGVATGIEAATGLKASIKWPNDVEIGGRKVAGILVEAVGGHGAPAVVAGVGINHSWGKDMPTELAGRATSLEDEMARQRSGVAPLREEVLISVLFALEEALQSGSRVVDAARNRSSVLGARVVVRLASGGTVEGEATMLRDDGALRVVSADGTVDILAGEVEQLRRTSGS